MLTDDLLAEILTTNRLLSEKELRNARERQKNVENEGLEESLIFLGLADYAKLGKAYAIHYKLPYYPVFRQGIANDAKERFSVKIIQQLMSLPVENGQKQSFTIVVANPKTRPAETR